MIKERMSKSLICSFAHKKWAICSTNLTKIVFFVRFLYVFLYIFLKSKQFAHSLFIIERCERIAQVAHQKWAMWANRSGCSQKRSKWANCSFFWANRSLLAHFFTKNERFALKTNERIPNPVVNPKLFCNSKSLGWEASTLPTELVTCILILTFQTQQSSTSKNLEMFLSLDLLNLEKI